MTVVPVRLRGNADHPTLATVTGHGVGGTENPQTGERRSTGRIPADHLLYGLVPCARRGRQILPIPPAVSPSLERLRSVPSPWNGEKRCEPTTNNHKRQCWSEWVSSR
jgi:hypothetical protein